MVILSASIEHNGPTANPDTVFGRADYKVRVRVLNGEISVITD